MKCFMFLIVFLSCSFNVAFAEEFQLYCQNKFNFFMISKDQIARRGCCSHHGGVCGCESKSIVCCDGSHSPTCGCNKDSSDEFNYYQTSNKVDYKS
jgi:hypothetical protein